MSKRTLLAEFIGTGTLAFAVLLSVTSPSAEVFTPALAALVLGLFVYSIGSISGCHLNPAVTIGLWSITKISTYDATQYIITQCVGALAAFGLVLIMLGDVSLGLAPESTTVFVAELIGTALFTFGIASVVYHKDHKTVSGLVIGGSLLLGITVAVMLGSAGILNPAVGLALGMTSLSYVGGAIAGGIIGMQLYRTLLM